MSTKEPFFSQFVEAQDLTEEEVNQVSGGCLDNPVVTLKYPSDDDEGDPVVVTMKYPSDDDEG